jgi:DNA-binding transcriptional LysR family regulator
MRFVNDLLARRPFDLYQLHLIRLVAESGSFTRAAQQTGLTQSAITRQIQGVENQLGLALFNRTTRSVAATDAGRFLLEQSAPLLGDADVLLRRLREEFADAPREVRLGVSRSVSLAYLPGFFAQARQGPATLSRVTHDSSLTILAALESDDLDVGVLLPPPRLSPRLRITHRFRDAFTFIANDERLAASAINPRKPAQVRRWLETQPWLALHDTTQTGRRLASWLRQQKLRVRRAMELDNFDLIINLVAVGLGVSLVPQRALALYARRHAIVRLPWPSRFTRELVVVVRRQRQTPEHIQRFVENILFCDYLSAPRAWSWACASAYSI